MNKFGKKVLAAGICAGMSILALTGCSSTDKDKVVATVDGTDITLGELNFSLRYQQAAMENALGALFGGANMWEQDLTGQGVAYGTQMKESVLEDYEEMVVLEKHMADYSVELTEEDKTAVSEAAEKFLAENDKKTLEVMTADEETVSRVLTLNAIRSKMTTAIQADVDTEVSDEEAAQKTIEYTTFSTAATQDEDGNTVERTDEEIEEIKQQAQSVIDAVKGGKTLEEAAKEIDENKIVTTYSYGADEETLNEKLKEAADKLQDGEIAAEPVEGENIFYVVRMKSTFDEEATEERKEEIVEERKNDLYQEVVDGWMPEDIKVNEKAWEKVTFDVTFTAPETESESAAGTETGTEAESESAAGTETEAVSENESAAGTETEAVTESESAAETETVAETEAASETESETK